MPMQPATIANPATIAKLTSFETVTDASVPETILPIQYFDRLSVRVTDIPEKRLMFAVLLDAVIHLQRRDSRGAAEAVEWIAGEPDGSVFSFQNICEALGLEPSRLARALLAWHHGPRTVRLGVPARQLRTAHPKIRPLRQRRRRDVAATG
jgi:hypothetical protein